MTALPCLVEIVWLITQVSGGNTISSATDMRNFIFRKTTILNNPNRGVDVEFNATVPYLAKAMVDSTIVMKLASCRSGMDCVGGDLLLKARPAAGQLTKIV